MEVITIDDASTRDVDDGLSVEILPSGQQRLWVHIADPTRWLAPGDPLDAEARRRAKTLYLPTGLSLQCTSLLYLAVVPAVHIHFTCHGPVPAGNPLNT